MKTITKITMGLAAAALLFTGCSEATKATPAQEQKVSKTITEESLGLRNTDLYSEKSNTMGDKTSYNQSTAGSGYKFKRAFQDAPPMIPHDISGMVPITVNNNQCIGCHAADIAPMVGATAIPPSHMTDFRPVTAIAADGTLTKNGKVNKNSSCADLKDVSIKQKYKLVGARFNCTQCHAPQSNSPAPKNTFEADYAKENGSSKSSWNGAKLMEGLDTVRGE